MILVDSSAFIEFYRLEGRIDVREAVLKAIAADEVAINGIIQTEVVGFAKGSKFHESLKQDFEAFHWIEMGRGVFERAAEMGYTLRSKGITVPSTDLIIAASAMIEEATLLHLDRHFELISQHFDLKQISCFKS